MRHRSASNTAGVRDPSSRSTPSIPRVRPSSSKGALPTVAGESSRTALCSSAGVLSLPQPTLTTHENRSNAPPREPKKKMKEKKKGRPQNALFSLASAFNGGATVSANVVDLHSLDASLPQVSCKRCIRAVVEDVPPTQILSFLYLGSVKDAQDSAFLAKHNIRYIINVSQEEYWSVDKRLQVFTFKVDDSATADIASLFPPTRSLINNVRDRYYRSEAAGKASRPAVLVHCQKGRSRSATIVLAYLICTNGWSVAEAMKYVGTRRPCAEPNIGFMEELRKLQESLPTEERTKRYSELCWFMRNLDAQMSEAQVREMFEHRIGFVRDVVMLTAPANAPSDVSRSGVQGSKETSKAANISRIQSDNTEEKSVTMPGPFSMGEADKEGGGGALSPKSTGGEASGAETHEAAHTASSASATSPLITTAPTNLRVALCFVFLTCREDILRGIKHGDLRDILAHLRPAPGKHIKYATGPKLRKLMTEHQSMSSSFVQDMAPFNGQLRGVADTAAGDHTNDDTKAASTQKEV